MNIGRRQQYKLLGPLH